MFTDLAYAMGTGQGGGAGGGGIVSFLPLIAIFGIFYFLLIRPQQKKQKDQRMMMENLKKGDRVITQSGIHGTIVKVKDQTFIIEVAEKVKMEFSKSAIAAKKPSTEPTPSTTETSSDES